MNVIPFERGACDRIRRYVDSYVSNELLVETNHEVLRHVETCAGCAAALETQLRVKAVLRSAVIGEAAPPAFEDRIRAGLRQQRSGPAISPWLLTAAAALAIVFGGLQYRGFNDGRLQVASLLDWGATDHTLCALGGHYPPVPPTMKKMGEEDKMGPGYVRLVPVVRQAFPEYEVIEGHRCNVAGRRFPHITLRLNGKLTSVSLLRKTPGEDFPRGRFLKAMEDSGIPLYTSKKGALSVAGFETPGHLVFVVSESPPDANLARIHAIAGPVREVLAAIESGPLAELIRHRPQASSLEQPA